MKVSQWHKNQGDEVGFNIENPDIVYGSCIFKVNAPKAYNLLIKYSNSIVAIGGPGIGKAQLPDEINLLKPDYSLYPDLDYSIGYSTRGCPRKCYFCIVPAMEGNIRIVQHPREWHNEKFEKIIFLDNNILALKNWFFEVTDWIIEKKLRACFNQGLDIRLIDFESAKRLSEIRMIPGHLHTFAFDDIKSKEDVLRGIELLKWHRIHLKNKVMFFVYVHDDSQVDDALERCNILREARTNPWVMCNIDKPRTIRMKQLQRWANRKQIFWITTFDKYIASQEVIEKYHKGRETNGKMQV